jgi:hypothetical protein
MKEHPQFTIHHSSLIGAAGVDSDRPSVESVTTAARHLVRPPHTGGHVDAIRLTAFATGGG